MLWIGGCYLIGSCFGFCLMVFLWELIDVVIVLIDENSWWVYEDEFFEKWIRDKLMFGVCICCGICFVGFWF